MAITFDAVSTSAIFDDIVSSLTWSHTVGAGDNRALVVGVRTRTNNLDPSTDGDVLSVTYNGLSLALGGKTQFLSAAGGYMTAEAWVLAPPPVGTANVVVTMVGVPRRGSAVGLSFFGVRQSTPIEASGSTTGDAVTTFSATVTTLTANAMTASFAYSAAAIATLNAGPTQRDNVDVGGDVSVSATQAVASPASTSATWDTGIDAQSYAALAVSIAEAVGAAGDIPAFGRYRIAGARR